MRIVLSGYYGFDNVGDEAILYSMIQALRKEDKDIKITVLSNQPEKTARQYGVDAVNRWNLQEVRQALKGACGLISGGGSLLQDATSSKTIPYYTGIIWLARLLKKPVFIYAQGMGPFNKSFSRALVKKTLEKTEITVRDKASKNLLQEIGVKKEIHIVPDPVLGIELNEFKSPWWEEQNFSQPVMAVSVRDWPSEVPFAEKIAASLDRLEKMDIVFVPMHGEHDDAFSRKVASLMKRKAYIAPYEASIEEKISIIGKSNLLVGMRLHALIFASVVDTPFIALSYDPKIDAFAEIAKQLVAGHVCEQNWDENTLYELILEKQEHLSEEKEKLIEVIRPQRELAQQTAKKALAYFKK